MKDGHTQPRQGDPQTARERSQRAAEHPQPAAQQQLQRRVRTQRIAAKVGVGICERNTRAQQCSHVRRCSLPLLQRVQWQAARRQDAPERLCPPVPTRVSGQHATSNGVRRDQPGSTVCRLRGDGCRQQRPQCSCRMPALLLAAGRRGDGGCGVAAGASARGCGGRGGKHRVGRRQEVLITPLRVRQHAAAQRHGLRVVSHEGEQQRLCTAAQGRAPRFKIAAQRHRLTVLAPHLQLRRCGGQTHGDAHAQPVGERRGCKQLARQRDNVAGAVRAVCSLGAACASGGVMRRIRCLEVGHRHDRRVLAAATVAAACKRGHVVGGRRQQALRRVHQPCQQRQHVHERRLGERQLRRPLLLLLLLLRPEQWRAAAGGDAAKRCSARLQRADSAAERGGAQLRKCAQGASGRHREWVRTRETRGRLAAAHDRLVVLLLQLLQQLRLCRVWRWWPARAAVHGRPGCSGSQLRHRRA